MSSIDNTGHEDIKWKPGGFPFENEGAWENSEIKQQQTEKKSQ